ncbi:hypothetical protein FACS1894216_11530 [Synergistales bacterium]|nr:hypothetical protein FACS1894216_11530 [Synergistales bacterium]
MRGKYNLSLIFYPQDNGAYTVVCPELVGAITEGGTIEEAEKNIMDVIADFLPDRIGKSERSENCFREGLCMKRKLFREIEAEIQKGEVLFSPVTADDTDDPGSPGASRQYPKAI